MREGNCIQNGSWSRDQDSRFAKAFKNLLRMILGLGVLGYRAYQVCINDNPMLTLAYLTSMPTKVGSMALVT